MYFHSLQATNFCRNSRLVVDEDDLKWVVNETNMPISSLLKQFHKKIRSKPLGFSKANDSSEMHNYALMHREGLTL